MESSFTGRLAYGSRKNQSLPKLSLIPDICCDCQSTGELPVGESGDLQVGDAVVECMFVSDSYGVFSTRWIGAIVSRLSSESAAVLDIVDNALAGLRIFVEVAECRGSGLRVLMTPLLVDHFRLLLACCITWDLSDCRDCCVVCPSLESMNRKVVDFAPGPGSDF